MDHAERTKSNAKKIYNKNNHAHV